MLLLSVLGGVITHFYTRIAIDIVYVLFISGFLLLQLIPKLALFKWSKGLFLISVISLFYSVGIYLSEANDSRNSPDYFGKHFHVSKLFKAIIIDPPVEKAKSIKCVVNVQQVGDKNVSGKTLLYLQKDSLANNLKYGDVLCFESNFTEIQANGNPHEFDYKRYLSIHNIHHQSYLRSGSWKKTENNGNALFSSIYELRDHLSEQLERSDLSDKNLMVANALLLGQKEYLDKEVLRSYSSAGAMHVLAVSGLHVGIVMLLLMFIFAPIKKHSKGKLLFISLMLLGIWFYAIITGLSPSVLRASVMFSFIVIGKELQRDTSIYQSIMVSAFLLILIEPYIIFQVGFQLSYLAVIGIIYLQPKIANLIFLKNFILDKAWQITSVSIAAQLATFPLGLYYFHQFPNFFMISNLIVIPLAFGLLIIGLSYFILHWIPFISDVLLYLFDLLLTSLNIGVDWIQGLPYSIVWGISIHWYEVFLLYLILLLSIYSLVKKSAKLLIVGLAISVFQLALNVYEKQVISAENKLFVYNVSDEIAIDVFTGSHNIFYTSDEMMSDEEKLLFHVKHNWFYRSGKENPTVSVSTDSLDFIRFGDQTLFICNERSIEEYKGLFPETNLILIESIEYIPQSVIDHISESDSKIILGPNIGYKLKGYLKKELENCDLHLLKEQGVFELNF